MARLRTIILSLALVVVVSVSGGCSSLAKPAAERELAAAENDPFEGFNRAIFRFNEGVDDVLLEPIARGYIKVLPQFLRNRFRNVFLNLLEPTTIVNGVLQGKFLQAINDTFRFGINSTVGLLGMFDLASKIGLPRHQEDFGQTFAVWGIGAGPYLVVPFYGPTNVRDGIGLIPQFYYLDPRIQLDDNNIYWGLLLWDVIDTRSNLLGATRVLDLQLDPYLFLRESYRQRRLNLIHDGNPPLETFEEPQ